MLETDALKEKLEMEIHRFARPPEGLPSGDPYVQIAAASHDLFAKRVNGQIYRPLVEKYIAGEKRL